MALQDLGGAAALRNFGVEGPEWPQGWWVRREMGKRSSCRAGAQRGTIVLVHSGLQQQEAPKGRAEQQGEVVPAGICVCGPGGKDRKDLVSVVWEPPLHQGHCTGSQGAGSVHREGTGSCCGVV